METKMTSIVILNSDTPFLQRYFINNNTFDFTENTLTLELNVKG